MKCIKCGKNTELAFRYDIDCSPIPSCKECGEEIRIALFMKFNSMENEAKELTKNWDNPL